jgi:hypothetical protein
VRRTRGKPWLGRRVAAALTLATVAVASVGAGAGLAGAAEDPARSVEAQGEDVPRYPAHPVPRLKISLEGFSVDTPFGSSVGLTGGHVELYPVSQRWVRGGVGIAGGTGNGAIDGGSANVDYGLLGATIGVQYPARITPFVEGHIDGGFMSASVDRPVMINGVTVENAAGTTWLYGRGINAGAEFYAFGRAYLSGSVGWMRATWGSPDTSAPAQGSSAQIRFENVTSDSLMWKLGLGI